MKTSQYYEDEGGTKIDLTFIFLKEGIFTLEPLLVNIKNRFQTINFAPISISLNPKNLQPRLVIDFADNNSFYSDSSSEVPILTAKNGEIIPFKISLQYGAKLLQFNWKSPANSILSHIKEYDTQRLLEENQDLTFPIAIGDFELRILKNGIADFPSFTATALDYNGSKHTIEMPDFKIKIIKNTAYQSEKEKDYFAESFIEEVKAEETKSRRIISEADCIKLAQLRKDERWKAFSKARMKRRQFEKELNLPDDQNEFPAFFIPISIFFSIIFCLIFIIFIRRKNIAALMISSILFLASISGAIYTISAASRKHGISLECTLSSIPEASAEAQTKLPAGTYIQILERTEDWCYVKYGASGGWCSKDKILFIN